MLKIHVNWSVDRVVRAAHSISVGRLLPGSGRIVLESSPGENSYSQTAKIALALLSDRTSTLSFSNERLLIDTQLIHIPEKIFFRIYRIEALHDNLLDIANDLLQEVLAVEDWKKAESFVFEDFWGDGSD